MDTALRVTEAKAAEAAVLMDTEETVIKAVFMAEAEVLVEIIKDIHSLTVAAAVPASPSSSTTSTRPHNRKETTP